MEYLEFAKHVQTELGTVMGADVRVEIHSVMKMNHDPDLGLCILPKGEEVAPIVYLQPHFMRYLSGRGMVDVLSDIVRQYHEAEPPRYPLEALQDWHRMRGRICARLISAERNEDYLEGVPHRRFLDLALVYYILMEENDDRVSIANITRECLSQWGVTEKELYDMSLYNMPQLMPVSAVNLQDLLEQMLLRGEGNSVDLRVGNILSGEKITDEDSAPIYVVTNTAHYLGAIAIFYPDVLNSLLARLDWSECYVLPASIHEMIICPDYSHMGLEQLSCMVKEVNETAVDETDRLTDSVYYYSRESGDLQLMNSCSPRKEKQIFGIRIGSDGGRYHGN